APHQRTIGRIPFQPADSPYRFVAMVPQDVTESLLFHELDRKGGAVEYDTACIAAEDQADGRVSVTLERKGTTSKLTAGFVVGGVGRHSRVRHLLTLPFEGQQYDQLFMLADVMTKEWSADTLHLCPHPSGALAIFPMSATRSRVVATISRGEGDAPSLD